MAVYKKKSRWYTDLYDSNGRRIRQTVSIKGKDPSTITRPDAMKVEAIRKAQLAQGFELVSSKNDITFDKLLELYLDWSKENHKSYYIDISICKNLLLFFKGKKLKNITLWHIEQYKSHRKKLGRSEETINKELGAFRRMVNLGLEWGFLSTNPIEGMKLLRVPVRKHRVIRDWEFQKLYNSSPNHFKPILLTAYMTGMRKGEIQKLKWKDVDLEEGYITVSESKNNEYRTIPINKILLDSLKQLKENSRNEYLFTTPQGEPYKSNSAWKRVWINTLEKSSIEKCRFHDLRHTFISNLIVDHKVDITTVMALSGHRDIKMLQRYSHTKEEAKQMAIGKLAGLKLDEDCQTTRLIEHK